MNSFRHKKPRYTIEEAKDLLGKGRASVYELINAGLLESYTVGRRRYITPEGIDNVVEMEFKAAKKGPENSIE